MRFAGHARAAGAGQEVEVGAGVRLLDSADVEELPAADRRGERADHGRCTDYLIVHVPNQSFCAGRLLRRR